MQAFSSSYHLCPRGACSIQSSCIHEQAFGMTSRYTARDRFSDVLTAPTVSVSSSSNVTSQTYVRLSFSDLCPDLFFYTVCEKKSCPPASGQKFGSEPGALFLGTHGFNLHLHGCRSDSSWRSDHHYCCPITASSES